MKRAPYDRRDGRPAASVARRLPVRRSFGARFVCTIVLAVIAVCVALVPVSVDAGSAGPAPGVNVHKSKAHAATVVSNAGGFIAKAAAAAGLTEGEYIATCVGVVGASTGMNIANQSAVSMGATAAHNLNALLDTADYPAYNTLTEEQQQSWGSKENYDAAKFNSLMTAFGMGSAVSDYYQSGGGNFEFDEDVQDKLEQIGRIGKLWGEGAYNLLGNLRDLIPNRSTVVTGYLGLVETYSFDATDIDDWPEGLPRNLAIASGSKFGWYSRYSNTRYDVFLHGSTSNVYYIMFLYGSGTYPREIEYMFSKNPFVYGFNFTTFNPNTQPVPEVTRYNSTTSLRESSYGNYYRASFDGNQYMGDPVTFLQPVNDFRPAAYNSSLELSRAVDIIANSGEIQSSVPPDIVGYPDNVDNGGSDNTPIYYPDNGVTPDTTWSDLTTEPQEPPYVPPGPDERPQNPYNPSNPDNPQYQSGTPEWKQETAENLDAALHINFDKLFPFCLIYDLKMFVDKFRQLVLEDTSGIGEQAINDYEILRLPGLPIDGLEDGMEFDLEPLRNLLNLIRPIVFWVLLVYMLMSVIEFWRGILTGGD